uniref:Uncharacterized protein n=1 Tax=Acrobeloides nanus TaxID=290746 RepID=A0A914BYI6_9BILA
MANYGRESATKFPVYETRFVTDDDPKFPKNYFDYNNQQPYPYDYRQDQVLPRRSTDKTMWFIIGLPTCCCVLITIFVILLLVFVHYGSFYNSNWRNGWFW